MAMFRWHPFLVRCIRFPLPLRKNASVFLLAACSGTANVKQLMHPKPCVKLVSLKACHHHFAQCSKRDWGVHFPHAYAGYAARCELYSRLPLHETGRAVGTRASSSEGGDSESVDVSSRSTPGDHDDDATNGGAGEVGPGPNGGNGSWSKGQRAKHSPSPPDGYQPARASRSQSSQHARCRRGRRPRRSQQLPDPEEPAAREGNRGGSAGLQRAGRGGRFPRTFICAPTAHITSVRRRHRGCGRTVGAKLSEKSTPSRSLGEALRHQPRLELAETTIHPRRASFGTRKNGTRPNALSSTVTIFARVFFLFAT